jgi:PAS domain S-box-containing protein
MIRPGSAPEGVALNEQNAVALLIVSPTRDPVETINSILRRAGEPVHCTWLSGPRDIPEIIAQTRPQLLIHVGRAHDKVQAVVDIRDRIAADIPLIVVADSTVDEARIAEVMALGARDVVSLPQPARLAAVMLRELRAHRTALALEAASRSASDARTQLETVLQRSNDAFAQVQEGILVEANRAWLDMLGLTDSVIGEPVMDLFEEPTHAALRTALAACLQGNERTVKARALRGDGSAQPLEIVLVRSEHEGEPSVRLVAPAKGPDRGRAGGQELSSGLLQRGDLVRALLERMARPAAGGLRYLALLTIDRLEALEQEGGITASEQVVAEIAALLKGTLHPKEVSGRFAGAELLVLLERGNEHDVQTWAVRLSARIRKHAIQLEDRALSVSCTIGLAEITPELTIDTAVALAREQPVSSKTSASPAAAATAPAPGRDDQSWIKQVTSALIENRFRLVQQPIASLSGEPTDMFDVLLRMLDARGREVLPSAFMPAAERHDLTRKIDRWVIGASLSFSAQRQPQCLFVRLSRDSARDGTFLPWLDNLISRRGQDEPGRLCFQVTEEIAASHLRQVQTLSGALRERGFRFALEAFGSKAESVALLNDVPLDFVKIDGALIQGVTSDGEMQEHVRMLIEEATHHMIQTIGERVEDADTVTVLWEVGMQYIQGYFVNEPQDQARRAER